MKSKNPAEQPDAEDYLPPYPFTPGSYIGLHYVTDRHTYKHTYILKSYNVLCMHVLIIDVISTFTYCATSCHEDKHPVSVDIAIVFMLQQTSVMNFYATFIASVSTIIFIVLHVPLVTCANPQCPALIPANPTVDGRRDCEVKRRERMRAYSKYYTSVSHTSYDTY